MSETLSAVPWQPWLFGNNPSSWLSLGSHVFYLAIPEAFIRAGMPSSYCLFEFSSGYFVSLDSNSVFYRKTKIKCNLAILCPVLNALVWMGMVGCVLVFYFFFLMGQ